MDSYSEAWALVKDYCKGKVTETIYSLWLEPLTMVSFEDNRITLLTSDFKAGIVKSKFLDLLNEAFEATMGFPVEIEIVTENVARKETKEERIQELQETTGNSDLTFENFIVGSSNELAYATAQAVAKTPSKAYNPLVIYGNSGLGKTHLLNAICAEIKKNNPKSNIIYLRCEDFTNELVKSIEKNTMTSFHEKYRSADVLLIDDVQFLAGKTQTQEEFFHTFNELYEENKQIVLTSDRPPKEIALLEDRIKNRFEWGILADIQPPSIETRMAIINQKASELGLNLPDEVVQYIAEKIKSNIRQLEGAVKKLNALCTINGHEPSIILADKAIKDIVSDNQPIPVTIDKILNEVARTYGTTVENILSDKRTAKISEARQAAMYIIREITGLTTERIGEEFGGKHHSTVIYNINECEKDMENNSAIKTTIQSIINNINENR
ncbi:MAG: chromosomal replication initiator protein DnaA [Clostridia bacterium]|nr:chromosomal replication initiator protein DnaA [Clostridia bacterium]MCR4746973.1 chromosomal replication initiator protein DnaA [Clostridiales bacterium]